MDPVPPIPTHSAASCHSLFKPPSKGKKPRFQSDESRDNSDSGSGGGGGGGGGDAGGDHEGDPPGDPNLGSTTSCRAAFEPPSPLDGSYGGGGGGGDRGGDRHNPPIDFYMVDVLVLTQLGERNAIPCHEITWHVFLLHFGHHTGRKSEGEIEPPHSPHLPRQ